MSELASLSEVLDTVLAARTKYEVLGVPPAATENEIRIALRRLALQYHPDRHPEEDRDIAHQIFREVSAAYRVLIDGRERAAYDRSLATGTEYRESSEPSEGVTLQDILAEMGRFEHVFSESKLVAVDVHLRDTVVAALIDELGEQVVAVYPLSTAPSASAIRGSYKTGAVVVTSLRVLLPFSYQWEETDASQSVRYTGWSMPSYPMPAVTRFQIEQSGGLFKAKTTLRIETAEGNTTVQPKEADLAKIMIVARLWAIPVEAVETADAAGDLRRALFGPLVKVGLWLAALLAAAAVLGIFAGSFLGNPAWVLITGAQYGLWHILFLLCCIESARRIRKFVFAHRKMQITTILRENMDRPEDKPQTKVAVA